MKDDRKSRFEFGLTMAQKGVDHVIVGFKDVVTKKEANSLKVYVTMKSHRPMGFLCSSDCKMFKLASDEEVMKEPGIRILADDHLYSELYRSHIDQTYN